MPDDDDGFNAGTARFIWQTENGAKMVMLDSACNIEDGEEFWIPKVMIHDNSEVYKLNDEGRLIVTSYWARKEGWDE